MEKSKCPSKDKCVKIKNPVIPPHNVTTFSDKEEWIQQHEWILNAHC